MKNHHGFSIVSALIAMVIIGMAALALASLFRDQIKLVTTVEGKYNLSSLKDEIRIFITQTEVCTKNFKGQPIQPGKIINLNQLVDADGKTEYQVGGSYGDSRIRINKMQLTAPNTFPSLGAIKMGFTMDLEVLKEGLTPYVVRKFPIFVTIDPSKKILGCELGFLPKPIIESVSIAVGRNSYNEITTDPAKGFDFCALSQVSSGGNDGGGSDNCTITQLPDRWKLSGHRGDDPTIICTMLCMNYDGK